MEKYPSIRRESEFQWFKLNFQKIIDKIFGNFVEFQER